MFAVVKTVPSGAEVFPTLKGVKRVLTHLQDQHARIKINGSVFQSGDRISSRR